MVFDQFWDQLYSSFACFWSHPRTPASALGPQCRIGLTPPWPPAVRARDVIFSLASNVLPFLNVFERTTYIDLLMDETQFCTVAPGRVSCLAAAWLGTSRNHVEMFIFHWFYKGFGVLVRF